MKNIFESQGGKNPKPVQKPDQTRGFTPSPAPKKPIAPKPPLSKPNSK